MDSFFQKMVLEKLDENSIVQSHRVQKLLAGENASTQSHIQLWTHLLINKYALISYALGLDTTLKK